MLGESQKKEVSLKLNFGLATPEPPKMAALAPQSGEIGDQETIADAPTAPPLALPSPVGSFHDYGVSPASTASPLSRTMAGLNQSPLINFPLSQAGSLQVSPQTHRHPHEIA